MFDDTQALTTRTWTSSKIETELDDKMASTHSANGITETNISDWTTAASWGNHATQGYINNASETENGDLMSFDGTNWVSKKLVIGNTGSNSAINIQQPYLTLNYSIAIVGIFPSRSSSEPFIGEIDLYAFDFAPRGFALCNGQIMPISTNSALFYLLGTSYGGDGMTTFALPDLRGRVVIGQGTGPGLLPNNMGQKGGSPTITIGVANLPAHTHNIIYE
jgi:microcystin-dependent protein